MHSVPRTASSTMAESAASASLNWISFTVTTVACSLPGSGSKDKLGLDRAGIDFEVEAVHRRPRIMPGDAGMRCRPQCGQQHRRYERMDIKDGVNVYCGGHVPGEFQLGQMRVKHVQDAFELLAQSVR